MPKPNLKGQDFKREFSIGSIDTEKRTVELSFSSNAEVERYGMVEVLEHKSNSVDLSRLNDSGAFLFNHNRNQYLGVIEPGSAKIEGGSKGRCTVRFSESDFASEIFRDVEGGILTKSSVTYRILEYKEEKRSGKLYIIVTRWLPVEVSIVTIPADTTVGVGRSDTPNQTQRTTTMDEEDELSTDAESNNGGGTPAGGSAPASTQTPRTQTRSFDDGASARQDGEKSERNRVSQIMKIGQRFKLGDDAQRAIADGMSFEDFKAKALDTLETRAKNFRSASEDIGMSEGESRSFRFLNLLAHTSKPEDKRLRERAAFEIEACQAAAAKLKHRSDQQGLIIPLDVLRTPLVPQDESRAANAVSIKAGVGYAGTGANLVDTTLLTSSFVELLRNRTVFMRLARAMGGLVGNIDIPKQLTGPSGYWIGEDDSAGQDDITFGQLAMTPHTVATYGEITRRMLMQPSLDVEALFRSELIKGIADTINTAGFYGDGTGNAPVGIKSSTGINGVDFAAVNPTHKELIAMETAVASDNANPDNSAYVANATFRGYAKGTLKFDGISGTIWEQGGSVNGYRTEITNTIVDGDVFFGDFFEALLGMWGGLELTADPYTHSAKGRLRIVAMQDIDILVRRPENFTYGVLIP